MMSFDIKPEHRFLWSVVRPYRLGVFLFLAGSLLASGFDGISIGLLIPLLQFIQGIPVGGESSRLLQGISRALDYFPRHQLLVSLGFVAAAVVIKNLFLGLAFMQGVILSNRVTAALRIEAMKRIMWVDIDFHHQSKSGEILDKIIQHTQWLKDLMMSIIQFTVFCCMFVVLLALLLFLSWSLFIMVMIFGSIAMLIISRYLKKLPKLGSRSSLTSRRMTQAIQENLSAVYLIKTLGREQQQLKTVSRHIEDYMHADNHLAIRSYWVQPINEILGVSVICAMFTGATYILPQSYQLELPRLLPFLYVLIRMVQTLKILNDSWGVIKSREPYLKQVHDLLREDNKPHLPDGSEYYPGLTKEIQFEGVFFAYDISQRLLDDISFTIPAGGMTAIVGRSGSGKSTITNLLLRLYDPTKGRVLIDGRPLTCFQTASYRARVGVVSQDTFLFNASVKHNISFGVDGEIPKEEVIKAAEKAGIHDLIVSLPEGYETLLGDRGVKLSGGERQRIAIARIFLRKPEILIMDEATSSLDAITEQQIHDTLWRLGDSLTTIIIAHRPSTVQNVDQVIVLKDGAVVEIGNPVELLENKQEYYSLMRSKEDVE